MRGRIVVLILLSVMLAITAVVCLVRSNELQAAGYRFYTTATGAQPSPKAVDTANHLIQAGAALQQLVTPLSTGALFSGLAVLVVLAGQRHLRETRRMRAEATS